jgi:hypothetical protein
MTEPTTEAGRRLLDAGNGEDAIMPDDWLGAILAIEAEARADFAARLREAVKALPSMPMVVGPWDNAGTADAVLLPAVLAAIEEAAK